jgi:hypothetical protein
MNLRGKICATAGSIITIAFGVWHFFVPAAWKWYSHLPEHESELAFAIRAINFFFSLSLVLFGSLCMLYTWHKTQQVFYTKTLLLCMMLLWGARVVMQVIYPQGSVSAVLQYGMLGVFILTFLLFFVSAFSFTKA